MEGRSPFRGLSPSSHSPLYACGGRPVKPHQGHAKNTPPPNAQFQFKSESYFFSCSC